MKYLLGLLFFKDLKWFSEFFIRFWLWFGYKKKLIFFVFLLFYINDVFDIEKFEDLVD